MAQPHHIKRLGPLPIRVSAAVRDASAFGPSYPIRVDLVGPDAISVWMREDEAVYFEERLALAVVGSKLPPSAPAGFATAGFDDSEFGDEMPIQVSLTGKKSDIRFLREHEAELLAANLRAIFTGRGGIR